MSLTKFSLILLLTSFAAGAQTPTTRETEVRFYLPGETAVAENARLAGNDPKATSLSVSPPATVSLDGEWDFYYDGISEGKRRGVSYALKEIVPELPLDDAYEATMPTPAYWDDNLARLQPTSWWFWAQFNTNYRKIDFPMGGKYVPPFGNLSYLVGTGYYRKVIHVPNEWVGGKFALELGGVVANAKVYVNGSVVGEKNDYLTPATLDISSKVRAGKNVLIVAVTNRDTYARGAPTSCAIDGFAGFSGGIYGRVNLHVCSPPCIKDLYIFPSGQKLRWRAEIDGFANGSLLRFAVIDNQKHEVSRGELSLTKDGLVEWDSDATSLAKWSEQNPALYTLDVETLSAGQVRDHIQQLFGRRTLRTENRSIFLNDKSLMLRGICDSWYYPKSTTAPLDKATYAEMIRKYKELGFNWIRFHTSMPRQEYLDAADELGMLIQVESPRGSDEQTWLSILKAARRHPSVILYCVSNEQLLDEDAIAMVRDRERQLRELVPDALFSPMEALRGVEYGASREDFGQDAVDAPFLHNPRRLDQLRKLADVIEPTGFGNFSFGSAQPARAADVDAKLDLFDRPCLLHEVGIHGTYLDLSLTNRYVGTRIGTDLYDSVRRYLAANGLESKAGTYYRNSCRWAQLLRKHAIERARLCGNVKGYDLLGAVDIHWMFCGYTCGVMNEFLELKSGESVQDVLSYNGESVLLSDLDTKRVFAAGDGFATHFFASIFGDKPCESGTVKFTATDDSGKVLYSNQGTLERLPPGKISPIGDITFKFPDADHGSRVTITATLRSADYSLQNQWQIWAFPPRRSPDEQKSSTSPRIATALTHDLIEFMNSGGRVLLLGTAPFHSAPMTFQIAAAGRVLGNVATIITEHPFWSGFPHDGFCDWQFYDMLNGANAVVFDMPDLPFEPILEVASSYKLIKKQAAIFELRVGEGGLLVCSLNIRADDPAGKFLLQNLIDYAGGSHFKPKAAVSPEVLDAILKRGV